MKRRRLLLCRSQSEAMILSRRLSACGIDALLTRPPRSRKVRSCSWGIALADHDAMRAEACLRSARISPDVWCWEDSEP